MYQWHAKQLSCAFFYIFGLAVISSLPLEAQETDDREFPEAMVLPELDGPKPWSDKPLLNDPERFHFAIMTDRTGGHRPGIWMKGVRSINLMRPEFVLSVGDLIEGYTQDEEVVQEQWKEFLEFIDQMDMRFFFVAGNHDVTNPVMHRIWCEHFGPEWYSFDYKGVHFICLSSEDPQSKIGEEQLQWIREDLEDHEDAKWTIVSLHKPLWTYAERELAAGNPDPTNWKQVESLLGDRPHTVFSGHVHHYVQYDRNGTKYYHLATTGGGSRLRGRAHGEFDHIVWVTMEKDGPRIANLMLDGVQPADVVTEKGIARYREFLTQSRIRVAPILVDAGETITEGQIRILFRNDFKESIKFSGSIQGMPLRGLSLDASKLEMTAQSGEQKEINVAFQMKEPVHFDHFAQTVLAAQLRSNGEDPLKAEITLPVTIDRRYPCPEKNVVVDGQLDEWDGEEFHLPEKPLIIGAADQWQGKTDGDLLFRVAHDAKHVYVSGTVTDDRVTEGDRLYVVLDARPIDQRIDRPRLGQHAFSFELTGPLEGRESTIQMMRPERAKPSNLKATTVPTSDGYRFEIALPISCLVDAQGQGWKSFQFTPVILDIDDEQDGNCFVVWRGTSDLLQQNTNMAHFFGQGND